jgi:hypothetical protein
MSNPGTDHADTNVLVEVSVKVDVPLGVDVAMGVNRVCKIADVAPPTRETSWAVEARTSSIRPLSVRRRN